MTTGPGTLHCWAAVARCSRCGCGGAPVPRRILPAAAEVAPTGQTLVRMGLDWIDTISEAIYGADAFPDINDLELDGSRQLVPDGSSLAAGVGSGLLGLLGVAGNLGNGLLRLLFVLAVALMISIQPQAYRSVGLQLIPSFYRRRGRRVLDQCGAALSSWMVGVLISSLAVFVLCSIALTLLGVKLVSNAARGLAERDSQLGSNHEHHFSHGSGPSGCP